MKRVVGWMTLNGFALCVVCAMGACGCAPLSGVPFIGHPNSDDTKGEVVELSMITTDEWDAQYKADHGDIPRAKPSRSMIGIDMAVRAAIDLIKAEVEKEAARHERQFACSIYRGDFWKDDTTPRYAGFALERYTRKMPKERGSPAFRLVCAFVPTADDPRIFLIRPVFFETKHAKAKVSSSNLLDGSRCHITSKVHIRLEGAWINDKSLLEVDDLAVADFKQSNYSIHAPRILKAKYEGNDTWTGELADHVFGFFLAPPISHQKQSGGAFKLSVLVTEIDESKAKEMLIRISEFVTEQKPVILEKLE